MLHQIGDRDAATAALGNIERRLSSSAKGYEWKLLAQAFREVLGDEDAVQRCLASARQQARDAPDFVSLAEGHIELLDDPASARELLDHAEALARGHGEHRELWTVAIAWRERVRDDARARSALAIGTAESRHLQALTEIHATGRVPSPLGWCPIEVLALTRWSLGEATDHRQRAFACAVLALDRVVPDSCYAGDLDDILAPLLESAWTLGLDDELEHLLVWLAEVVANDGECRWALLALILSTARRTPTDPRLPALVECLIAMEEAAGDHRPGERWLWRRQFTDPLCTPLWNVLIAEVLDRPLPSHLERLAQRLR